MPAPAPGPEPGHRLRLVQSIKGYFATWVDLLKTRVELFSTEVQEEKERTQQIVILGAAAGVCLSFGLLLGTLLIVAAFWETNYRLAVLGACAVLYLAAGSIIAFVTWKKHRQRPKLLSATIAELAKDYQHLSS